MTPRLLIVSILIIGLGLFIYSLTLPYYITQEQSGDLIDKAYPNTQSAYYAREAELRTRKLPLMDLGAGLTIASLTILGFMLFSKIKSFSDFNNLKTINRTKIFITSNIAWLILIPGTYWYYSFRLERGDYPPFADSVAIPMFAEFSFYLLLLIPLNAFLFITTTKSNLSTNIFIKAKHYRTAAILWEMFFGIWLALNLFLTIEFVIDGDHFLIPVNLFFTYILLILRAGQISKFRQTIESPGQMGVTEV